MVPDDQWNNLKIEWIKYRSCDGLYNDEVKLSDNPLFQQATRSSLNPHNGQFFIDIDRTINAGNLPLPYLSPEVRAGFQAVKSLGVTSAILDESSNRFDMFIALKKVPGIAKLPAPPKAIKPSPQPTKLPSPKPTSYIKS